jgi:hypothetical protein
MHAGLRLVVLVFAPRKTSRLVAFCMNATLVRPSPRRLEPSIASAFRVLLCGA